MYYSAYKCKVCKKETILVADQVEDTEKKNRYIVCSHCSSKKIVKEKETDDLREIMGNRAYKREGGRLRQTRFAYG